MASLQWLAVKDADECFCLIPGHLAILANNSVDWKGNEYLENESFVT